MKCLLLVAILAGAVVSVQATCQQDFEQCKKAYEDGLPDASGKPGALCLLGNTYISCLRNLTETQHHPDCGNLTKDITEARRKEEEMLARNVSGCMLCTSEVDKCDEAFKNSYSQAGKNLTAVCAAANTMEQCLEKVDNRPECAPEKSHLEEERRKAQEKINQAGCGAIPTGGAGVQSPSSPVTLLAYTFLAVAVAAKLY